MEDFDFHYYFAILKRHLRAAIVIATAVIGIGLPIVYLSPTVYRATSKILIESPQIPEGLAKSTVPLTGIDQIQIIEQQMLTSSNLLELARRFRIFANRPDMSEADIVDAMRAKTSFTQIPFLSTSAGGATAFAVAFDAHDGKLAADVSSEIANQILAENVRIRTGLANDTLQFFQQDEARLSAALSKLEAEILVFKTKNKDALPDSLDFHRSEQATQQERLLQLQREEAALRDRRTTLVETFQNTGVAPAPGKLPTSEEQVLAALRKSLVEQQLVYSEQSATIKSLRAQIAALEAQIKSQEQTGQHDAATGKKAPSEFDIQLAEIDGRLSYITVERAAIQDGLAKVTASILATPANAVTLNVLERNYQNIQQQYNAVTAKLAEASTGEQIELRSKGVKFSIIELADPPQKPLTSKRYAFAGGIVFAGIALGLAFIVLRELLTGGVRRALDIERKLQITPFVTIPYIYTRSEVRWKWMAFAATMLVTALVIPAAITTFHFKMMPIDLMLNKLTKTVVHD